MASRYAYIAPNSAVQITTQTGTITGVLCEGSIPALDLFDTADGTTTGTQIARVASEVPGDHLLLHFPDVTFADGLYAVAQNGSFTVFYA